VDRQLTQRRLLRTWLPTAFGASVLVAEIPVVYAAAARSTDGARALAALGICLAVLVVVNGARWPVGSRSRRVRSWRRRCSPPAPPLPVEPDP
jgi:hypothetical protein